MSENALTDLEPRVTENGEEVLVDLEEDTHGSKAPFYAAYARAERPRREGWFCSQCGSADTVMDPMQTIECTDCGNRRKPTNWDAAYL